ncbi:MAG: hypothetical protein Fur0016_22070 [Anaerolineales bacterium]
MTIYVTRRKENGCLLLNAMILDRLQNAGMIRNEYQLTTHLKSEEDETNSLPLFQSMGQ